MEKQKNIKFNILAVVCIIIMAFAITPREFQNDTFYTIKIGEHIMQNGIDMQDPFSWHENLPYTYPHWAYDVATYLIYNYCGGFFALYITTFILTTIMGILLYYIIKRLSKNGVISFIVTLAVMFFMKSFIAARAQLVTFILFELTIYFIEKFIETKKIRYGVGLIIIPILIANVHCAVWPFYFVLFLPYLAEYFVACYLDSYIFSKFLIKAHKSNIKTLTRRLEKGKNVDKIKEKIEKSNKTIFKIENTIENRRIKRIEARNNPYRIKLEKNKNVKWLLLIIVISAFTGLLTPIGDAPYTYLIKTYEGNTTKSISEHLPITLINHENVLIAFSLFLGILIFTDTKIKLRDLFMLGGLTILLLMSRRQVSLFMLIGGIIFAKLAYELFNKYDNKGLKELSEAMTTLIGKILVLSLMILIMFTMVRKSSKAEFINSSTYPVEATKFIKDNLDYKNIRLFNEYNYGSYLLFQDIPVFIDSRADLYSPEFNGEKKDGKYEGRDIFSDFMNVSSIATWYENVFDKYDITHVILKKNTKLNMIIKKDENYKELYSDDNFVVYERNITDSVS